MDYFFDFLHLWYTPLQLNSSSFISTSGSLPLFFIPAAFNISRNYSAYQYIYSRSHNVSFFIFKKSMHYINTTIISLIPYRIICIFSFNLFLSLEHYQFFPSYLFLLAYTFCYLFFLLRSFQEFGLALFSPQLLGYIL